VGFPILADLLPNKGVLNIVFVPIDFSDSPGTAEHMKLVNNQIFKLQQWYKDFSQGKLRIEATPSTKWFRASKPTSSYTSGKGDVYSANNYAEQWDKYAQELINATGSSIDYSKTDAVFFYFPAEKQWDVYEGIMGRGTDLITPQGKKNLFYWADGIWHNDELKSLKVPYADMYSLWIHELLHSQGISLHAPAGGWRIGTGSGMWDSTVLDAWETFLLGWLDDSQVYCAPLKVGEEVTVLLDPIEIPSNGIRTAIIPLNSRKAIVVEARRSTGYSAAWDPEDNGSFVYLVDMTKDNDRSGEGRGDTLNEESWDKWAYLLLPEGQKPFDAEADATLLDWKNKPHKRYFLKPGNKIVFDGVEVTSIESGTVDALKLKRLANSQDISVGTATGIIRPYQPKKITSLATLDGNLEGIAYWPWKLAYDKVKNGSNFTTQINKITIDPKVGPKSKFAQVDAFKTGFGLARGLWERFIQPKDFIPIYFTYEDSSWAQAQFDALSSKSTGDEVRTICPSKVSCSGAHVESDMKDKAVLLIALPSGTNQISEQDIKLATAKAFTLAVQQFTFKDSTHQSKASCCIREIVPIWFIEGLAEFTSAVVSTLNPSDNYFTYNKDAQSNYLIYRKTHVEKLRSLKLSLVDIENFLSTTDATIWRTQSQTLHSGIGFLSIEAIIAANGLVAPLQSLTMQSKDPTGATSKSFSRAFFSNFGISWDEGVRVLAKHIFSAINS
jgi:hypothetical protein